MEVDGELTPNGTDYWVAFGVNGRGDEGGENGKNEQADYFHQTGAGAVGLHCTLGCVSSSTEQAKWIYDNCGRGTPVLIW